MLIGRQEGSEPVKNLLQLAVFVLVTQLSMEYCHSKNCMLCVRACMCVCMITAVHRLCSDGSYYCNKLLLLLPGVAEFTHHGVVQEPGSSGSDCSHS